MNPNLRLLLVTLLLSAGCATAPLPTPAPVEPAVAVAPTLGKDVLWVRDSAEYRAIFVQTYRLALERLEELAAGSEAGRWAVVLDADETMVGHVGYQVERQLTGTRFEAETWDAWVRRREFAVLPAVAGFVDGARALGGRIVVVTNQLAAREEDVAAVLRRDGVIVDAILPRVDTGDKGPRFAAVEAGTASPDLPPLEILMWVGDNVKDFPGLDQDTPLDDPAWSELGDRYFLLPNPMYGSWE